MNEYIKVSRSITFSIPGTSFAPQKVQVDLSRAVLENDAEAERKKMMEQLNKMLVAEVHNHVCQVVDIVTAPDIDALLDYLEKEIGTEEG